MKVLLVRLRLIGDVVFTTPVIRSLRQRFPHASISYVVEPEAEPVLRYNPHLTQLIVAPRRRGLARLAADLQLAKRLRAARFDIAIDLHGGPRSAWLTWASGAPTRVGYTITGRQWMYTHRVPRAADLAPRHSVLNQADLLAPLGIGETAVTAAPVEMPVDPAVIAAIDDRLAAEGIGPDNPIAVIHVSAGNPFRRWPAESFATLATALVRQDPRRRVVLVSGPSDAAAATAIAASVRVRLGDLGTAIHAGEYDLQELRALIARAAVYIGGDSGPLHIAATTTTPIVALLGPTLGERSRPWREGRCFSAIVDAGALPCRPCAQRHCVPGDFRCLSGIDPEAVIAATERAFGHSRDRTEVGTLARERA